MGSFKTPLLIKTTDEFYGGRAVFELLETFSYELNGEHNGLRLTVPAGFKTDFATVPRFLWPIFPPIGKWGKAAVLHDYMYRVRTPFNRWMADAIFRLAMKELGVSFIARWMMWTAVRLFGRTTWKE